MVPPRARSRVMLTTRDMLCAGAIKRRQDQGNTDWLRAFEVEHVVRARRFRGLPRPAWRAAAAVIEEYLCPSVLRHDWPTAPAVTVRMVKSSCMPLPCDRRTRASILCDTRVSRNKEGENDRLQTSVLAP